MTDIDDFVITRIGPAQEVTTFAGEGTVGPRMARVDPASAAGLVS